MTTRATIPTAALSLVGSLVLATLSYFEHIYSCRPSTLLNLFLLFSSILQAVRTRTLWLQGYNRSNANATLAVIILQLLALGFEMVDKRKILKPEYQNLTPEATCGIFSTWLFSWQLPLFRAGYNKSLEIEDLFELDKHLQSRYLQSRLRTEWSKCTIMILSHMLLSPLFFLATCADYRQHRRRVIMPCYGLWSRVSRVQFLPSWSHDRFS